MVFKGFLMVIGLAVFANSLPTLVKRQMPSPPMPPGVPAPPMSPPGMIIAAYESQRMKRQAPETTPPGRFVRQAPETTPPGRFVRQAPETTPPDRFIRQAPETTPPARVARSVMYESPEMPKTIAQESFYSKITTINGDK